VKPKAAVALVLAALLTGTLANCSSGKSNTSSNSSTPKPTTTNTPSAGAAAQDNCRLATAAEVAEASGLRVKQAKDLGPSGDREGPGCYYADDVMNANSAVMIHLFDEETFDNKISRITADPEAKVQDVPGLGQDAKYVTATNPGQYGGELFVEATSTHWFSVRTSQESREDSLNSEIPVARLLLSRM
jgi:hypothetical protein